jgi:hypothetical protein
VRTICVSLLAVLAGLSLSGKAEGRTLEDAVQLALQEATIREEEILADLVRGTPEAQRLRRGKRSLEKALAKHKANKVKGAAHSFAKGVGNLWTAFGSTANESGLDALAGVLDEIDGFVRLRRSQVEYHLAVLDSGAERAKTEKLLVTTDKALDAAERTLELDTRAVTLIAAYLDVGLAAKQIDKYRDRAGRVLKKAVGLVVPRDLPPRREYGLRWRVNGTLLDAGYRTRDLSSKLAWRVLRDRIVEFSENRVYPLLYTATVDGTEWDGFQLTVTIVFTCAAPDGPETVTVKILLYRVDD